MAAEVVTKRLHISGLTPQISRDDLVKRFSSFGDVKSLDGLGKLDGNGDPRPYAYITIETTKGQLAKCLNLLSGTTWKGARLRIGDAKPDFRERIEKENEAVKRAAEDNSQRPRKRRRLARGCQGVFASDMSLVNASNFSSRSGWRKTPLGRLIRPMRMRPLRPLHPPASVMSGGQKMAAAIRKRKRRKKEAFTRQRRELLDPELWGSEYLKGVMLETGNGVILPERRKGQEDVRGEPVASADAKDIGKDDDAPAAALSPFQESSSSPPPQPAQPGHLTFTSVVQKPRSTGHEEPDLAREAANSLALLTSLFGNASDEEKDWGGSESLSDVDVRAAAVPLIDMEVDAELEIVPKEKTAVKWRGRADNSAVVGREEDEEEDEENEKEEESRRPGPSQPPKGQTMEKSQAVQVRKLKDMFAPREEQVGFSILSNLAVDLELDETFEATTVSPPLPSALASTVSNAVPPVQTSYPNATVDSSKALFFPLESSFSSSGPLTKTGKGPQDIVSLFRSRGWAKLFHRTESAEEIRNRWESSKVDLTREWKRRHREAVKSARRRGGLQD